MSVYICDACACLQGDVSELGLTFSADVEAGGMHREVELKRGGRDIPGEGVGGWGAIMRCS
jgi:hypothetical protein